MLVACTNASRSSADLKAPVRGREVLPCFLGAGLCEAETKLDVFVEESSLTSSGTQCLIAHKDAAVLIKEDRRNVGRILLINEAKRLRWNIEPCVRHGSNLTVWDAEPSFAVARNEGRSRAIQPGCVTPKLRRPNSTYSEKFTVPASRPFGRDRGRRLR